MSVVRRSRRRCCRHYKLFCLLINFNQLGTEHSWVKRIQVCTKEGQHTISREMNRKLSSYHDLWGRVGRQIWGRGQTVTWWDMVKILKTIFYQKPVGTEMYVEACPCYFHPILLKSWPTKEGLGQHFTYL